MPTIQCFNGLSERQIANLEVAIARKQAYRGLSEKEAQVKNLLAEAIAAGTSLTIGDMFSIQIEMNKLAQAHEILGRDPETGVDYAIFKNAMKYMQSK